jgi:hypothetical protein
MVKAKDNDMQNNWTNMGSKFEKWRVEGTKA